MQRDLMDAGAARGAIHGKKVSKLLGKSLTPILMKWTRAQGGRQSTMRKQCPGQQTGGSFQPQRAARVE